MTAKEFFKSTSFKCIAVLLSILLVCGVLLTLCNAVFKVTEKDLRERAISQIYEQTVDATEQDLSTRTTEYTYSTIQEAYYVEFTDKKTNEKVYNYLVKVTGKGGFGGDVGCYVAVNLASDKKTITGIYSVQIISAEGESFLSNITSAHLKQITEIEYTDGFVYEFGWVNGGNSEGKDFINTGASMTMRAISNAVNGAINLVKEITTGTVTAEPEPVPEPEPPTIYDDFKYAEFIDKKQTSHKVNSNLTITYHVVVNPVDYTSLFKFDVTVSDTEVVSISLSDKEDADGTTPGFGSDIGNAPETLVGMTLEDIQALFTDDTFTPNSNVSNIFTGASLTGTAYYRAAAFALANYDKALASAWEYASFVDGDETSYQVNNDDSVTFHITVNPIVYTESYGFDITVSSEGKITSMTQTKEGSTGGFEQYVSAAAKNLVGKTLADIEALYQDKTFDPEKEVGTIFTGASYSDTAHYRAAAYALANYNLAIILGGNA